MPSLDGRGHCGHNDYMKGRVGARELKARPGATCGPLRQGSTLVVTDRGDPVAELRPLGSDGSGTDAGLGALEALGVLTRPAKTRLTPFRPCAPPADPSPRPSAKGARTASDPLLRCERRS